MLHLSDIKDAHCTTNYQYCFIYNSKYNKKCKVYNLYRPILECFNNLHILASLSNFWWSEKKKIIIQIKEPN